MDVTKAIFISYMNTILHRKSAEYWMKQNKIQNMEKCLCDEDWNESCKDDLPQSSFIFKSLFENINNEKLSKAFSKLTNAQKEVLELSFNKEYTNKEIAQILKITEKSVESRKIRAFKIIKNEMEK